jgi:hypothetical protein
MSNQELFSKIRELNLPPGKYALFGSAPMGVRGLKDCHDIDVIVTEDMWGTYRNRPEWIAKVGPRGDDYLENGEIELWKNWRPGEWEIQKLIDSAELIDGLPFVRLHDVLKWKRLNGREKDLKDIEIIENFLKP